MLQRELEICTETLQGCEAAATGGADRIELCAALNEGGVTPGRGLLREALDLAGSTPVHVLVRPRSGNFLYTPAEFRALCHDVEDLLAADAAGVVVGVLTPERRIDHARTETLIRLAASCPITFHRAFDHTADLFDALNTLLDLGCHRILTSGGQPTVSEGYDVLAQLAARAGGRVRIAAGGGVTPGNAAHLLQIAGLDLHGSFRAGIAPAAPAGTDALWQGMHATATVSADTVQALRTLVHAASV